MSQCYEMSVRLKISCDVDGCVFYTQIDGATEQDVRMEAKRVGWGLWSRKDYCPGHENIRKWHRANDPTE